MCSSAVVRVRVVMEYVLMLETKQGFHYHSTEWLMVVANVAVKEDSVLLECYTVSAGEWLPTFQRHHDALEYW